MSNGRFLFVTISPFNLHIVITELIFYCNAGVCASICLCVCVCVYVCVCSPQPYITLT